MDNKSNPIYIDPNRCKYNEPYHDNFYQQNKTRWFPFPIGEMTIQEFDLAQQNHVNVNKTKRNKEIVDALMVLDTIDLVRLVIGTRPYIDTEKHPLIAKCASISSGYNKQWEWYRRIIEKLSKEELIGLYMFCRDLDEEIKENGGKGNE